MYYRPLLGIIWSTRYVLRQESIYTDSPLEGFRKLLTECVTQRSPGLLVTMLCQVSPSLNVANVHLVLLGTQAVLEGAQLPGGQLAHFWGQRHEGHIPTGTSVSAATQNTLFQMDDLCHQQHEIIPGGIGFISNI